MAHAEKCPVCGGSGKVPPTPPDPYYTAVPQPVTCHGCGGLGWVTVECDLLLYPITYQAPDSDSD